MGRRNQSSFFEEIVKAPWWISAILSVVSYLGLRFLMPSILENSASIFIRDVAKAGPSMANFVFMFFVITGIASAIVSVIMRRKEDINAGHRKELYEQQKSLPDINALKWQEFEEFIGEAYRRQGYQVEEKGGNQPDGGIDLILRKKGEMVLVQCKHWETEQVGVNIVRELYGVVAAEGATKGIVVTTGYFTRDAEMFAHGKPLLLIRGNELSRLIEEGQKSLI